MPFPRVVARFNKRYTNRFLEPIARRRSGFAVVHHVGRRSGIERTTPVNVFGAGDRVIVALTYGPGADWFRNVLAGEATIELDGRQRPIRSAELVGRDEAWGALPLPVRLVLRALRVREFCALTLGAEG